MAAASSEPDCTYVCFSHPLPPIEAVLLCFWKEISLPVHVLISRTSRQADQAGARDVVYFRLCLDDKPTESLELVYRDTDRCIEVEDLSWQPKEALYFKTLYILTVLGGSPCID